MSKLELNCHVKNLHTKAVKGAHKGTLVSDGWNQFEYDSMPNAPAIQKSEMRKAFYVGAQYMLASMVVISEEATEKDADVLFTNVQKEVDSFLRRYAFDV